MIKYIINIQKRDNHKKRDSSRPKINRTFHEKFLKKLLVFYHFPKIFANFSIFFIKIKTPKSSLGFFKIIFIIFSPNISVFPLQNQFPELSENLVIPAFFVKIFISKNRAKNAYANVPHFDHHYLPYQNSHE